MKPLPELLFAGAATLLAACEPAPRGTGPRGPTDAVPDDGLTVASATPAPTLGCQSDADCQPEQHCCATFSGCQGVAPMPGEQRPPCDMSTKVCASVPQCWGPPPSAPPGR